MTGVAVREGRGVGVRETVFVGVGDGLGVNGIVTVGGGGVGEMEATVGLAVRRCSGEGVADEMGGRPDDGAGD